MTGKISVQDRRYSLWFGSRKSKSLCHRRITDYRITMVKQHGNAETTYAISFYRTTFRINRLNRKFTEKCPPPELRDPPPKAGAHHLSYMYGIRDIKKGTRNLQQRPNCRRPNVLLRTYM